MFIYAAEAWVGGFNTERLSLLKIYALIEDSEISEYRIYPFYRLVLSGGYQGEIRTFNET